jgi:xylan 1,4-beta-xylosidase
MKITNPILTGFNPDPSICVVDGDFYVATSTFEWFPGVQIHHSRDLRNWRLLTRPLNRISQLDLKGCQHSGGVWAPCLTHADGLFWLVYTNVRSHGSLGIDAPHFLITAPTVEGPWSEPVMLGANGFDPSLFHDADGRKYLVNMQLGPIGGARRFDGITLQEYDHAEKRLIGKRVHIWEGTELGVTEGPHLYRKDGWYYLVAAEGGTGWRHAVSVARSRDLFGPYETDPANPMLTAAERPDVHLKCAGHADFFQTQTGDWYMVHLCQRPLQKQGLPESKWNEDKVCILGRETALQRVEWPAGQFPRLKDGGNAPHDSLQASDLPLHPWTESLRDDFDGSQPNLHFQTLREPYNESWLSLSRRPGWLSLKGRNSLFSRFEQSLLARRLQHFQAEAETCLCFDPKHPKQEAGLIAYYDRINYHYLRVTATENGKLKIGVVSSDNARGYGDRFRITEGPCMPRNERLYLKMANDHADLRFAWRLENDDWTWFDTVFDSTNLGDWASEISSFTGTFWGLCCQDASGDGIWAEFDYFDYRPAGGQPEKKKLTKRSGNHDMFQT